MSTPIEKLTSFGQSLWLDNIQRRQLENGELKAMIERGDIRGMTSNPTIFNNAISKSKDYDFALVPLAWSGWEAEKIFWELAIEDIRAACDLFTRFTKKRTAAMVMSASRSARRLRMIRKRPHLRRSSFGHVWPGPTLWSKFQPPKKASRLFDSPRCGRQYQCDVDLFVGAVR